MLRILKFSSDFGGFPVLRTPLILLSIFSLAFFTACNDTPAPVPAPPPTLEVSPLQISVTAGDAATALEARVTNSTANVLWTLEGAGTLSSMKGLSIKYTPPTELNAAGTAKVTVALEGTKLSQVVNISLAAKVKPYLPYVGFPADFPKTVYAGGPKLRFTATLGFQALGYKPASSGKTLSSTLDIDEIEWSLAGPGTLEPLKGEFTEYTPPDTLTAETPVTIMVQYKGYTGSPLVFFVHPKPVVPTLTLSPSSLTIVAGTAGVNISANLLGSTETVNWTLEGVGSLSNTSGKTTVYTPPSSVTTAQTVKLTARAGALSQSATLTVTPAPKLSLSPSSATLTAGDAGQTFTATLENSSEPVNWTLEGVGTLSGATGPMTVYTPPSSVTKEESVKLTARAGALQQSSNLIVRVKENLVTVTGLVTIGDAYEQLPLQGYKVGVLGKDLVDSDQNGTFRLENVKTPYNLIVVSSEKLVKVLYGVNDSFLRIYNDKNFSNVQENYFSIRGKGTLGSPALNVDYPKIDTIQYKVRPLDTSMPFNNIWLRLTKEFNGNFFFNDLLCKTSSSCKGEVEILRTIKDDKDIRFEFGHSGQYNFTNGGSFDVGIVELKPLEAKKFMVYTNLPPKHVFSDSYMLQYNFSNTNPSYAYGNPINEEGATWSSYIPKFDDGRIAISFSSRLLGTYGVKEYSNYVNMNIPRSYISTSFTMQLVPQLLNQSKEDLSVSSPLIWSRVAPNSIYTLDFNFSEFRLKLYTKNDSIVLPDLTKYGLAYPLSGGISFSLSSSDALKDISSYLKVTYNTQLTLVNVNNVYSESGFRDSIIRFIR